MPLIQINMNDAKELFGDIVLGAKERAILYRAPNGYVIQPQIANASSIAEVVQ